MTSSETLRAKLLTAVANEDFSEALLRLQDGSQLYFCHRVGERWAKAVGPALGSEGGGLAEQLLAEMVLFRLNAKHLDIQFSDDSRWEAKLSPPR